LAPVVHVHAEHVERVEVAPAVVAAELLVRCGFPFAGVDVVAAVSVGADDEVVAGVDAGGHRPAIQNTRAATARISRASAVLIHSGARTHHQDQSMWPVNLRTTNATVSSPESPTPLLLVCVLC